MTAHALVRLWLAGLGIMALSSMKASIASLKLARASTRGMWMKRPGTNCPTAASTAAGSTCSAAAATCTTFDATRPADSVAPRAAVSGAAATTYCDGSTSSETTAQKTP